MNPTEAASRMLFKVQPPAIVRTTSQRFSVVELIRNDLLGLSSQAWRIAIIS